MITKNETIFWKKKEFVSFVLCILVFFIHSYLVQDVVSDRFLSLFNHKVSFFFSRAITRFAVPMFFILSGITFYKGYSNDKYLTKIKSRLHTLVIPYLLWNTVWMLWEAVTRSYPLTVGTILKGVFFYGGNQPFWFLFDLIIFSFAAPLVFSVIRNKYIGIGAVVLLSVASLFGLHLPEAVFYYPMAIVFYLIGALIGYHAFDFAAKKSSRSMQIASFGFLTFYIFAKTFVPQELQITNYFLQTVVYTLSAFAFWNITDSFIEKLKPRKFYRRSFAVYAMHLNIAIIVLKLLSLVTPASEWMEIPKLLITVVVTLVIINVVCAFLEKYCPKLDSILFGNRAK